MVKSGCLPVKLFIRRKYRILSLVLDLAFAYCPIRFYAFYKGTSQSSWTGPPRRCFLLPGIVAQFNSYNLVYLAGSFASWAFQSI